LSAGRRGAAAGGAGSYPSGSHRRGSPARHLSTPAGQRSAPVYGGPSRGESSRQSTVVANGSVRRIRPPGPAGRVSVTSNQ
jgi:hypothetical protein